MINIKRIYEEPSKSDGVRILVDRLWPRGIAKDKAAIYEWAKELAPSGELRNWFGHKPERWPAFQKKYTEELKNNNTVTEFMKAHKKDKLITLLYGAKDEIHNQAVVLRKFLQDNMK